MAGGMQVRATRFCGISPERPVLFIGMNREQFIEVREMIGGIAKRRFRYEFNQLSCWIPHRVAFAVLSLMDACAQNCFGLLGIIKRHWPVTPAVGGEN